ncbi:MAG: enolase C-terminal domain-like protein, partial [Bacteroidota bacterium]
MIIQSWQVSRFQVPLRFTFSQANQHTQHSDSLILRLQTKGGIEAFGEACPRTYVTGESPESVQADLQKVESLLIGLQINSFADLQSVVFQLLAPKIGLASLCLLEIALLDAWGKSQGHPLAKDLGVSQEGILHYSGIVPLTKPAHLQKLLPVLKSFAFAELKIKVGNSLSDAIETIAIIKEHWGDSMPIRVDANTSWTVAQAYEMIP